MLDAGCGSGRVAIELARRGVEVVGADADPSMLSTARQRAPEVPWVESDLADLDLGRTFDVVMMAGSVPLFTPPGTTAAVVAGCARHLAPGGRLIAGFHLQRSDVPNPGYDADAYAADAAAARLHELDRYATWDSAPFAPGGDYVVFVHARSA